MNMYNISYQKNKQESTIKWTAKKMTKIII